MSSHLLHDLQRVCDHVILLAASRTQLCDDIDNVLASHRVLVGPRRNLAEVERNFHVIKATQTARQTRLVVRLEGPGPRSRLGGREIGLEDVILAYMGQDDQPLGAHADLDRRQGDELPRLAPPPQSGVLRRALRSRCLRLLLLVTGVTMAHDYHVALTECSATRSCSDLAGQLFRGDGAIMDLVEPDPRRAPALRAVLGCTPGCQRVRGRHAEPGLDPGRHPAPLVVRANVMWVLLVAASSGVRRWCPRQLVAIPGELLAVDSVPSTSKASSPSPIRCSRCAGLAVGSVFRACCPRSPPPWGSSSSSASPSASTSDLTSWRRSPDCSVCRLRRGPARIVARLEHHRRSRGP